MSDAISDPTMGDSDWQAAQAEFIQKHVEIFGLTPAEHTRLYDDFPIYAAQYEAEMRAYRCLQPKVKRRKKASPRRRAKLAKLARRINRRKN